MDDLTYRGVQALKSGDKAQAYRLLSEATRRDPGDAQAWLWLSGAMESSLEQVDCLRKVLAIDPDNGPARQGLEKLLPPLLEQILTGLKPPQRESVLHKGSPLLIVAGPGSGKTEVIARRVAYLVLSGQADPAHILAVTFTTKAALELKDRIQRKLPQVKVESMQVSTVHSFCADLLRRYAARSAVPHGFRILDQNGQFLQVYSNRKAFGLDAIMKGRPQDFYSAVLRTFNLATEELIDPDRLEDWCQENQSQCADKETDLWNERKAVADAYRLYCEHLKAHSLVDFAFLQRYALDLLRANPDVVEELRRQYPFVLVDEYQDTNAAQEGIIRLLAGDGCNLTVVGDDDQSIYRFRGATVRNLTDFEKHYANVHRVVLVDNFRSYIPIVDHSLEVIAHNNPARFEKELVAYRGVGNDVFLVYERTAGEEAAAVGRLLRRLRASGRIHDYGEVVILLRSVKNYAGAYQEALAGQDIPSQVIGDATLFEKDEIAELYHLFNFLGASKEWGDKYVRDPLVGLSEATCEALKVHKGNLLEVSDEAGWREIGIDQPDDIRKLELLLALKRQVQAQEHSSALGVFYDLLAATGCLARFELAGDRTALSNLGIFSQLVASWDEYGSTRNFYPFREYLDLLRQSGVDPALPEVEDCVRIMTIHQAKGLQFPVVVLGAAMDGRLPSTRRKDPYEIPYSLRASGQPEVSDPHLVDERKLFYVAATRAQDLLIVSTADVVNKRGGGPSPFVREMFGEDLQAAAAFSEEKVREIESRASREQGPRPRYSYSQLAYYLQCPLRYKYTAVYGLAVPWLDPVNYGANVHLCLEAIHQHALHGEYLTPEDLPALVDEIWTSPSQATPELEAKFKDAAVHQLAHYLAGYGARLPETVQAETPFSTVLGDQILLGKIDLVRGDGNGGLEIVDFKTSKSGPGETEQARLQLSIYALGVENDLGRPLSHTAVHFLGDEKVESWPWGDERKESAIARLGDLFARIDGEDFSPNRAYCAKCQEFKRVCPYSGEKP